jgi:hypothetical protein
MNGLYGAMKAKGTSSQAKQNPTGAGFEKARLQRLLKNYV